MVFRSLSSCTHRAGSIQVSARDRRSTDMSNLGAFRIGAAFIVIAIVMIVAAAG
jgi:hypothetical protein